jgi:ATP-dependent Zn protease
MSFQTKLNDSTKLLVAAVSASSSSTVKQSKNYVIGAIVTTTLIWTLFVFLAFYFFSRTSNKSGERFRFSLGFSLATLICPFFSVVPICLNIR